ncbi:MAG: flagellar basal body P-ring formation chaperone FlgA [Pseudomonadota bacterium]
MAQSEPSGSAALRASPPQAPPIFLEGQPSATRADTPVQQVVVAARHIAAQTAIAWEDVALVDRPTGGGFATDLAAVVGLEARSAFPAGRALRTADLQPSAVIDRNERVALLYRYGALTITTEGLALERAPRGARLRVMNLSSRRTVVGVANARGQVEVSR